MADAQYLNPIVVPWGSAPILRRELSSGLVLRIVEMALLCCVVSWSALEAYALSSQMDAVKQRAEALARLQQEMPLPSTHQISLCSLKCYRGHTLNRVNREPCECKRVAVTMTYLGPPMLCVLGLILCCKPCCMVNEW